MINKELADLLRTIIREELQPIDQRINSIDQRISNLEKGQKQIQTELRGIWEDIRKLDKRLIVQEEKAI